MSGNRRIWFLAILGVVITLFLVLVAYWPQQPTALSDSVLRVPITESITTVDPIKTISAGAAQVSNQVFDRLVEIDTDLTLKPAIAEHWETKDNVTWTFTIRSGVRFHDDPAFPDGKGREVSARDVVYSINRLLDPKSKTSMAWILNNYIVGGKAFSNGETEDLKGIEALDDRRVRFTLTRSYSPFPYRLAIFAAAIVPKEAVEKYAEDFGRHPVGTGPFRFSKWVPDTEIELIRNPNYWEPDLPKIDRLRFLLFRDEMIAFLNFSNGDLDLVNIPPSSVSTVMDEYGEIRPKYAGYAFHRGVLARTEYYAFLLTSAPWAESKKLRQALNFAINREEIIQHILKGQGVAADQIISPVVWGYSPKTYYQYDPERAKTLLEEAGFPEGKGLGPLKVVIDAGTETEQVAVAVQDQLKRLGLTMEIDVVQFPQLVDLAFKGQAPIFRLYFSAIYPHPENFLFQFLEENTAPQGNNFFRYKNTEFEQLYHDATSLTSKAEQVPLYQAMSQIIMDDAPAVYLYHPEKWVLAQPFVKGLKLNGLEFIPLEKVSIEQ